MASSVTTGACQDDSRSRVCAQRRRAIVPPTDHRKVTQSTRGEAGHVVAIVCQCNSDKNKFAPGFLASFDYVQKTAFDGASKEGRIVIGHWTEHSFHRIWRLGQARQRRLLGAGRKTKWGPHSSFGRLCVSEWLWTLLNPRKRDLLLQVQIDVSLFTDVLFGCLRLWRPAHSPLSRHG